MFFFLFFFCYSSRKKEFDGSGVKERRRGAILMCRVLGQVTTFRPGNQSPPRKRKTCDVNDGQTALLNRDRFAATSSPVPKKKRAPRPQYTKEQEDFIWFCRDDLSMSWRKVVELYNNHWHPFEVEPNIRSESGLQSRYYRILDFPVKVRKKKEPSRPDLGLIPSTERRYPWMGVIKADIEDKKNLERNAQYQNAPMQGIFATTEERGGEVDGEGGLGSKAEGVKKEPGCGVNAELQSSPVEQWSSAEAASVCSRVILHTSETDSEVESEREWEKSRSPHGRYELKVPYHKFLSATDGSRIKSMTAEC